MKYWFAWRPIHLWNLIPAKGDPELKLWTPTRKIWLQRFKYITQYGPCGKAYRVYDLNNEYLGQFSGPQSSMF